MSPKPQSHAITDHRLHSPRPPPGTATPSARNPNLDSGNHDMTRLPTTCVCMPKRCAHPGPCRHTHLTYSQRILGVAPLPLALAQVLQHPVLATQTSAVATTTCLDYLHLHARTTHPSTASPTHLPQRRLPTDMGCGRALAPGPRSQTRHTQRHNFGCINTLTAEKLRTCISWRLSSDGAHLHAHRPLRYTTSNGYWVWHPAPRSQTTHGNSHCLRLKPRQRPPRHV
jgi:hypothetical protein